MPSLLHRLRERKLVQWVLAYLAAAWLVFQAIEVLADPWSLPTSLQRSIHVLLVIGFFLTLVVAWYHGEQGRQRVSGPELLIIAALLAIAGSVLAIATREGVTGDEFASDVSFVVERDKPTVAVLPFANLSGREEDRYFADGFHEDVLNQLAKISGIVVLARQAVLRYRNSDEGPREIGRALSASAILEGSVRREGDRVRVTAQLIDVTDEAHLWSEQYDETLTGASIFAIQSGIAEQVARAIGAVLSPEEESRVLHPETQSLTAYDFYLRARALGPGDQDERIRLLNLAVEDDPEFAPAWAALGLRYGYAVWYRGWDIAWADSARAVAERAIELAPDQPDGYKALAYAYVCLGRTRAYERASRKIVELAPSDAFGVRNLALALELLGSLPEAVEWNIRGIGLHPHDVGTRENLASLYVVLGLPDRAMEQLQVLSVLDPSAGYRDRARMRLLDGDLEAALRFATRFTERVPVGARRYVQASKIAAMAGNHRLALAWAEEAASLGEGGIATRYGGGVRTLPLRLGIALTRTGNEENGKRRLEESLELLGDLIATAADDPSPGVMWELAETYAALNRRSPAIEWAQRAIDAGFKTHPRYAELDPVFDSLRGDPDFERIIARIRADQEEMRRRVLERESN